MIIIIFDSFDQTKGLYETLYTKRIEEFRQTPIITRFGTEHQIWSLFRSNDQIAVKLWDEIDFNQHDSYYYCVHCKIDIDIGNFYPIEFLSKDKIQLIADYNINVWYDHSREYYFPSSYNHYIANPEIYFRSNIQKFNSNYSGKFYVSVMNGDSVKNLDMSLNLIDFPIWFTMTHKAFNDVLKSIQYSVESYFNSEKKFLYLSLNGVPRKNRTLLIHGLRAKKLLDCGLVSLRQGQYLDANMLRYAECRDGNFFTALVQSINDYNILPAMLIDNGSTPNFGYQLNWVTDVCFDIISETIDSVHMDTLRNAPMTTEKTVKALLTCKPFLLNGETYALERLRKYGFKTFPYVFDESYDTEMNYYDRLNLLLNNVTRWQGKEKEFMEIVSEHKDDLLHNKRLAENFPIEEILYEEFTKDK